MNNVEWNYWCYSIILEVIELYANKRVLARLKIMLAANYSFTIHTYTYAYTCIYKYIYIYIYI